MLVDGHAVVHRAFHAFPGLSTARGELVNAVFGFTAIVLNAIQSQRPSYLAVAFDRSAPTFRHERFKDYKATRPEMAPELRGQFHRVREVVAALSIPVFELDGFEADDVLGTLSLQASARDLRTVIVTGDLDALQLVSPTVAVLTPRRGPLETMLYDEQAVVARYGLRPDQIPDYKGLVGDTSDNIPGVRGIGEKSASTLLAQYDTIEGVYAHLEELKPRLRDLLAPFQEQALESKRLATIVTDVPITLDLATCRIADYDRQTALDLFAELEFRSLLGRLPGMSAPVRPGAAPPTALTTTSAPEAPSTPSVPAAQAPEPFAAGLFAGLELDTSGTADAGLLATQTRGGQGIEATTIAHAEPVTVPEVSPPAEESGLPAPTVYIIDTDAALDDLLARLRRRGGWAFDLETTSVQEIGAEIVGVSFAVQPGLAYYLPLGHDEGHQLDRVAALGRLKPVLEDPTIAKVAHNGKFDMLVLAACCGITVAGLSFDTMIAAYLINPGRRGYGLKDLAFARFGTVMTDIVELIGKGRAQKTMAQTPIADAARYAGADADMTLRLRILLERDLTDQGLMDLFERVEMPLVPVLTAIELAGIDLDVPFLREMATRLHHQSDDLTRQIYELVGHTFNLNSPKQLQTVLFTELALPAGRKTSTGYSTDADVLETLRGSHPAVDMLLEYRQLTKLNSTYVEGLPALINPRTGRVHTSFNQTLAATGRLSSSGPNLQNIPIRTEVGREIRRAFITRDSDTLLLGADYSQIELRILAHLSQDARLLEAFHSGEDIHVVTAALMFKVAPDAVDSEMRRVAKMGNYGVTYGLSEFGLAQNAGISRKEARRFIEEYNRTYPGVAAYMETLKEEARRLGYVSTLLGRRRYIPEINDRNRTLREAAERAAINMPVQGTQADLIKIAMIRIAERMRAEHMHGEMILQVHDELVFRVPRVELSDMAGLVAEIMTNAMQEVISDVPIGVDVHAGLNWAEMAVVLERGA